MIKYLKEIPIYVSTFWNYRFVTTHFKHSLKEIIFSFLFRKINWNVRALKMVYFFSGYQAHLRVGLGSIQWSSTWSSQEQLHAQIGFQNHDWNSTWQLNPIRWREMWQSSVNTRFLWRHWTSQLVRRCESIISRENRSCLNFCK